MNGVIVQVSASTGGVPNYAIAQGEVTPSGLVGDSWRHPGIHGGPQRAILLMTAEGIEQLAAHGFPVSYGSLGENFTTRGLDRRALRIGQRFAVGEAIIELTLVRPPCGTLDIYGASIQSAMCDLRSLKGDVTSPLWGMSGFYASVVKPGMVRPGDPINESADYPKRDTESL